MCGDSFLQSLSNSFATGIFYVHQNDLHGTWPFCPLENNETKQYEKYGFDCDKITCSEECCDDISCYESVKESN